MIKLQQAQEQSDPQQQQDTRAMYDPKAPYIYETVPTSPAQPSPLVPAAQCNPAARSAGSGTNPLQVYQRQLMLSEGQNKKRLMTGQQGQGQKAAWMPHSPVEQSSQALAGMDMYNSAHLGGQRMQGGPATAQSGNQGPQDYQMRLMLLEQQNKKRLMMARQNQEELFAGGTETASVPGVAIGKHCNTLCRASYRLQL